MDTIYIHGLEVQTIIGLYDWERIKKQSLIFDIDILSDLSYAINHDALSHSIDYAEVANKVEKISDEHSFLLIEPLAEEIAQMILNDFNAQSVTIKVNKPQAIKNARSTGIIIRRTKIANLKINENE